MKKSYMFIAVLSILNVVASYAQSVSMNIIPWTGADRSVVVASVDKITFTDSDFVLNYSDGASEKVDLRSIRKITFNSLVNSTVLPMNKENEISLFFDADNQLEINNLPEGRHTLFIYSITGDFVGKFIVDSSSPVIPQNTIVRGVYVAFINNQIIKFVRL